MGILPHNPFRVVIWRSYLIVQVLLDNRNAPIILTRTQHPALPNQIIDEFVPGSTSSSN